MSRTCGQTWHLGAAAIVTVNLCILKRIAGSNQRLGFARRKWGEVHRTCTLNIEKFKFQQRNCT